MKTETTRLKHDLPVKDVNRHDGAPRKAGSPAQNLFLPPGKKQRVDDGVSPHLALQAPAKMQPLRQSSVEMILSPPYLPPAVQACANNNIKALKELIEKGVDIEDTAGEWFDPPIHQALKNCNVELVQLLLDHGASLEAENIGGYTVHEVATALTKEYSGEIPGKMLRLIELESARRRSSVRVAKKL